MAWGTGSQGETLPRLTRTTGSHETLSMQELSPSPHLPQHLGAGGAEQNQGKCTAGSWHRHNPSPGHGLGLRLSAQPQTGNQLRGFIHLFSLSHLIYFSVLAP